MTSCANKENPTTSNTIQNEDMKENGSENSAVAEDEEKENDAQSLTKPVENEKDTQSQNKSTEQEKSNSTKKNANENGKLTETSSKEKDQKSNIKIPYPTFNNINNKDKVNELVLNYIKNIDNLYNNDGTSLNINYQVMFQNNKYISIYFSGDINSSTAAYPSKFRSTLNINVEKVSRMTLTEVANINEKFINTFSKSLESKFESLGAQMPDTFKPKNLNTLLHQADNNAISDVQSYFTSNEVVIILSVPHAIGDYIEVRIPKSSIDSYI